MSYVRAIAEARQQFKTRTQTVTCANCGRAPLFTGRLSTSGRCANCGERSFVATSEVSFFAALQQRRERERQQFEEEDLDGRRSERVARSGG